MSIQRPTPLMYNLPHSFLHVVLKDLSVFLSFLTPPYTACKWLASSVHALLHSTKKKKRPGTLQKTCLAEMLWY